MYIVILPFQIEIVFNQDCFGLLQSFYRWANFVLCYWFCQYFGSKHKQKRTNEVFSEKYAFYHFILILFKTVMLIQICNWWPLWALEFCVGFVLILSKNFQLNCKRNLGKFKTELILSLKKVLLYHFIFLSSQKCSIFMLVFIWLEW